MDILNFFRDLKNYSTAFWRTFGAQTKKSKCLVIVNSNM